MKSHDCHVLMIQILPIAIRGIMDEHVRETLFGLTVVRIHAPLGVATILVGLDGIQWSDQMLIEAPSPGLHIQPLLKVFSPDMILCHVKDEPFFKTALTKSPSG